MKQIDQHLHAAHRGMSSQAPDTKPGAYYVTIRRGQRTGYLAGPFWNDHKRALDLVETATRLAIEADPWAHFDVFGTGRLDPGLTKYPQGALNEHLGLEIQGTASRLS